MTIDLFLEAASPRGRSAALFEQLRTAIASGRLRSGDRLPTSRELAAELGVARSTITTVYGRLVAEGYAEGRTGDGTFVTAMPTTNKTTERASAPESGIVARRALAYPLANSPSPPGDVVIDLRAGRPDPNLFPIIEWRRCVTAAVQQPPPGYGHPAGLPALRRAIAAWISRSRGVPATPDQILVTAGAQGAFDLCARVLLGDGDIVAVENPGYPPAWRAFAHHGATLAPVPVDDDGLVIELIPDDARAIYVTPSHQSPTGAILAATRRRRLLDLAAARDAVVVEDDYDTEYRYIDRPLEPLYRLDADQRVVYVGSFSKTLSPSLRLGFIVAPVAVVDVLTTARSVVDTQPPHLTQAALASFIATGGFEKHLRRTRRAYRARRDLLAARLAQLRDRELIADSASCNAGLHTTVDLSSHHAATTAVDDLRTRGVAIETTDDAWIGPSRPGLVIGFGLADTDQLDRAISMLASALQRR